MGALLGIVFCILMGVMLKAQGISALLWMPLGLFVGLFSSAQIILPLILGVPRALWLIRKGRMRWTVLGRLLAVPLTWILAIVGISFLVGFFFPLVANYLYNNRALNLGTNLGIVAILLSPLSAKSRSDFVDDFNTAYQSFFTKPTEPIGSTVTEEMRED